MPSLYELAVDLWQAQDGRYHLVQLLVLHTEQQRSGKGTIVAELRCGSKPTESQLTTIASTQTIFCGLGELYFLIIGYFEKKSCSQSQIFLQSEVSIQISIHKFNDKSVKTCQNLNLGNPSCKQHSNLNCMLICILSPFPLLI